MPSPSTLNPRTALVLLAKNTSVSESELCDLGHDIIHVSTESEEYMKKCQLKQRGRDVRKFKHVEEDNFLRPHFVVQKQ